MGQRLELQSLLETFTEHVYFQPPTNREIEYPCIMYVLGFADADHADNSPYRITKRYTVTVVDRNPDSLIPDKVAALPMCTFNRFYPAGNLNHFVFNLYW